MLISTSPTYPPRGHRVILTSRYWEVGVTQVGEDAQFSLRRIAVPAFGPSVLWSVGAGAVLPVVALSARGLGASVGLAALFVGITTLSEFAAAVPAGVLVERIGERRALVA